MKEKQPKISVVTPSYKQGKFLEKTICSIIYQDYQNMEYIIIDAESNDESAGIIEKYQDRLFYWVSEPDNGQSDAINKGFQKATGDLYCWVNSDDVLFLGALKKAADVFNANPNIDIITGNVVYIDENDFITRCVRLPKHRWYFYKHNVGCFAAPAVFFKKDLYEKVGGLDINLHYSMDVDLWHKFRLAGAKVYHVDKYLGGFRVHSASKTGPRMLKIKRYFEHPETTLIRSRYIPNVTKNTVRAFRMIYKIQQIINLNYLSSWFDLQQWKEKTWQEIFHKS